MRKKSIAEELDDLVQKAKVRDKSVISLDSLIKQTKIAEEKDDNELLTDFYKPTLHQFNPTPKKLNIQKEKTFSIPNASKIKNSKNDHTSGRPPITLKPLKKSENKPADDRRYQLHDKITSKTNSDNIKTKGKITIDSKTLDSIETEIVYESAIDNNRIARRSQNSSPTRDLLKKPSFSPSKSLKVLLVGQKLDNEVIQAESSKIIPLEVQDIPKSTEILSSSNVIPLDEDENYEFDEEEDAFRNALPTIKEVSHSVESVFDIGIITENEKESPFKNVKEVDSLLGKYSNILNQKSRSLCVSRGTNPSNAQLVNYTIDPVAFEIESFAKASPISTAKSTRPIIDFASKNLWKPAIIPKKGIIRSPNSISKIRDIKSPIKSLKFDLPDEVLVATPRKIIRLSTPKRHRTPNSASTSTESKDMSSGYDSDSYSSYTYSSRPTSDSVRLTSTENPFSEISYSTGSKRSCDELENFTTPPNLLIHAAKPQERRKKAKVEVSKPIRSTKSTPNKSDLLFKKFFIASKEPDAAAKLKIELDKAKVESKDEHPSENNRDEIDNTLLELKTKNLKITTLQGQKIIPVATTVGIGSVNIGLSLDSNVSTFLKQTASKTGHILAANNLQTASKKKKTANSNRDANVGEEININEVLSRFAKAKEIMHIFESDDKLTNGDPEILINKEIEKSVGAKTVKDILPSDTFLILNDSPGTEIFNLEATSTPIEQVLINPEKTEETIIIPPEILSSQEKSIQNDFSDDITVDYVAQSDADCIVDGSAVSEGDALESTEDVTNELNDNETENNQEIPKNKRISFMVANEKIEASSSSDGLDQSNSLFESNYSKQTASEHDMMTESSIFPGDGKSFLAMKRRKSTVGRSARSSFMDVPHECNRQSVLSHNLADILRSRETSKENLNNNPTPAPKKGEKNVIQAALLIFGDVDTSGKTISDLVEINGFLKKGHPTINDIVHDNEFRELYLTPFERYKYPTLKDPGIPHDMYTELPTDDDKILEDEKDIEKEIEKLNLLIQVNTPAPSHLRRLGFLLGRVGKADEAMHNLNRAILYDPFTNDAYWYRHLLYLKKNEAELALKDLDLITENNKNHFGAYVTKARIYQALGVIKLSIVNYSAVIKQKPDSADAYYNRACLFEKIGELVYANEDFKVVRQLDPFNRHAIFNLAMYSFQKQLWDDSIQAFSRLIIIDPENGQGYLFRGRAYASIQRWNEALEDITTCIRMLPEKADSFFHRGCLLKDRNPDQALQDFSVSLLLDSSKENADTYFHRGQLYSNRNEKHLAMLDYQTAIELDPTKSSAYLELAILHISTSKNHEKSLEYLSKAILSDPLQVKCYLNRSELFYKMQMEALRGCDAKSKKKREKGHTLNQDQASYIELAIRDYGRAIHLFPANYLLYLYRGRLLLKQGLMREATYDFHAAFELNSGIAQTFVQRALVLSFQRKYAQIVAEFDSKPKYEIDHDHGLYLLIAKARVKCGDNKGALKDLSKAIKIKDNDPQLFLQKGICYENLKEWKAAIQEYTHSIQLNPKFAKAFYHRSICYHKIDKDCYEDLKMAIKYDPSYFDAFISRAALYHERHDLGKAILDCNEALTLEPMSIKAHLLRGSCRVKKGEYEMAIADFSKAIQLDKNTHHAFFNRAIAYHKLGDYTNALRDYSVVLLISNDAHAYKNRALLYWKLGDSENAILDMQIARTRFPDDAYIHGLLAVCLQRVGRYEESIKEFDNAIELERTNFSFLVGRGNVYGNLKEYLKSRKDYLRVLHINPRCYEALLNIGSSYQSEGLFKKAWMSFSQAIAMDPKFSEAYECRAIVHLSMKNCFGALLDIGTAIDLSPQNSNYITNRGVIYQQMGDNVTALKNFKIAIQIDPKNGLAYFNAANMFLAQNSWELAEENYNMALKFCPKDKFVLLNRSICKLMKGDREAAMIDCNLASQLDPSNPEVRFNLAALLHATGKHSAAEKEFTKVIELAPTDRTAYLMRGEARGLQSDWKGAMNDYLEFVVKNI